MLITSNFRDYYDNCAAYGVDTQVRYDRKTETFSHNHWRSSEIVDPTPKIKAVMDAAEGWGRSLSWHDRQAWNETRSYVSIGLLGFCGVLYRFVLEDRKKPCEYRIIPETFHVMHLDKSTMPPEWESKYRYWKTGNTLFQDFEAPLIRENIDLFVMLNAPVFVAYDNLVEVNPNLKNLGFQKIKDGVTAFQEISAFISGTLNTANQMKHKATDQELIQAHGFDKHSFRKGKTK